MCASFMDFAITVFGEKGGGADSRQLKVDMRIPNMIHSWLIIALTSYIVYFHFIIKPIS